MGISKAQIVAVRAWFISYGIYDVNKSRISPALTIRFSIVYFSPVTNDTMTVAYPTSVLMTVLLIMF